MIGELDNLVLQERVDLDGEIFKETLTGYFHDIHLNKIKNFIIETLISQLEDLHKKVESISSVEIDSNGRFNACFEMKEDITNQIKSWRELLNK